MAKNKTIKEQLQAELSQDASDPAVVAMLSEKLLDDVEGQVRFTVDAGLINRLGLELVGRQDTALSELIKNAYDADATNVEIVFVDHEQIGGTLAIRDDGIGMSEETVKSEENGIKVIFNWDADFTPGTNLGEIWHVIEHYKKESPSDHGTTLLIRDLRDRWTNNVLKRVWNSVLLLQTPFNPAPVKPPKGKKADPGFNVVLNAINDNDKNTLASIKTDFLDHALAEIEAGITVDGKGFWKIRSAKLDVDETQEFDHEYDALGPVSLTAHYFIYKSGALSGISQKAASQMGHEFGGIRVYRDGYRVLPYGENEDDWLKLAVDTGRRNLLVTANNINFFGHVEVSRENNPSLEETSSREGLVENEAFSQLQEFARYALEAVAVRIAEIREIKTKASQKNFKSKNKKSTTDVLQSIIDEIKEKSKETDEDGEGDETSETGQKTDEGTNGGGDGFQFGERENIVEMLTEALNIAQETEDEREEQIKYESMLRILASLGISIAIFGHEIQGAHANSQTQLTLLGQKISKLSDEHRLELSIRKTKLENAINRLYDLVKYVSILTSHTESREMRSVSLYRVVNEFVESFETYMRSQNIEFDIDVPDDIFTCPIH